MRRWNIWPLPLMIALWACVSACHPAMAQPSAQVAWLGIQERDDLPLAAAEALDFALRRALRRTLSPTIEVTIATVQSPRARRALEELAFMGITPEDVLRDREARALGAALGTDATLRAWVEVADDGTQVTALAAAVSRRQAAVEYVRGPAPPSERTAWAIWGQSIADALAERVSLSINELVRGAPRDASQFAAAADEFLRDEQPGIAALEFDRAIALAPREAAYYVSAARAYMRAGDNLTARRRLESARELAPDVAELRLELGRLYLATEDAEAAISEFERAVELGASFAGHMALGAALEQAGDLAGAREQYAKALELNPDDAEAAQRLAQVGATAGAPAETAIEIEAQPAAASIEVAPTYAEGSDPAQAVRQLRQLVVETGAPVRYEPKDYVAMARLMDREMEMIVNQARERWNLLERGAITAQEMKAALQALHERSDALARAAEGIAAPPTLERGYRHRVLAYNLLNQSDFTLGRYFEGHNAADYDQGVMARQGAITELHRAWDEDATAGWPTMTAAER